MYAVTVVLMSHRCSCHDTAEDWKRRSAVSDGHCGADISHHFQSELSTQFCDDGRKCERIIPITEIQAHF